MDNELIEPQVEGEVFESVLSMLLLDGIGPLVGLVSLLLIIIAGVRLYRSTKVPGSKYIYYSMVLLVIGFVFPFISYFIYGEDENWVFEAIINIYSGLASLLGAYGFWLLTNYVIETSANK